MNYGIDGGYSGILISKANEKLFALWINPDNKKVESIICLSDKYHTKSGIRTGMSINELKKIYPNIKIKVNGLIWNHEMIKIDSENLYLGFFSSKDNRIGKYLLNVVDEEVSEMQKDAKVNYIWIE